MSEQPAEKPQAGAGGPAWEKGTGDQTPGTEKQASGEGGPEPEREGSEERKPGAGRGGLARRLGIFLGFVKAREPGPGAEGASKSVAGPAPGPRLSLPVPILRIREEVPAWLGWVLGAIPILLLLAVWFAVTAGHDAESRLISPTILPSPVEVVRSFPSLWFERALTRNLFVSFGRVVLGFAVAVAVTFPLGLLMGSFTKVKAAFTPLSVFGAYLPIPTLVPLTLSLFGTGESQKVVFLAIAFGIFLLPQIVAAVDSVDDTYLKTAYTLGASQTQAVGKVLLAISWPDIYHALRLGFGVGWSYILLAEMVDMSKGLGGIIMISQRRGPREHIYLVLIVIVGIAFLTDKLWVAVGRRLFPYRELKR